MPPPPIHPPPRALLPPAWTSPPPRPVWLLLLSSLIPSLLPRIFNPAEPVAAMGALRGTVNAPTGPRREPSACRQARDKPPTRIRQAPDANPTSPRRESATRAGCPPPRARRPARLAPRRVRNAGRRDRAQVGLMNLAFSAHDAGARSLPVNSNSYESLNINTLVREFDH